MSEAITTLRRDLKSVRERLLTVVAGVTEEQFKRRMDPADEAPADGLIDELSIAPEWSIAEVLAHLLAAHRLQAGRIAAALWQDGARVEAPDIEALRTAGRAGRAAPVPQIIHGLLAVYRELEGLLSDAEHAQDGLERTIVLPDGTGIDGATLFRLHVIESEAAHAQRIELIRAWLGSRGTPSPLPVSSPAQRQEGQA